MVRLGQLGDNGILLDYVNGSALECVHYDSELCDLGFDTRIVTPNSLWTNRSAKHFALVGEMQTRLQ
jgi:hypothetical protein